MSNPQDIIKRAHASNVAAKFCNPTSDNQHGNFRHLIQMVRKASANN